MLNLFKGNKITAFGLDVSETSIKVMQLSLGSKGYYPSAFAEVFLAPKLFINHMIANEQRLAENIERAMQKAGKIDSNYVVVSVPETKSFVRTIRLPTMPEAEIPGALPWELEQDIPVPVDQVYLDWQKIKEVGDKIEILVTAAPKDYIDSLIETLAIANLKPVALELESQATARALIGPDDLNKAVLILDISAAQTSFIIVDHGFMEYTSSIPVAGNAFTEGIARALGVNSTEAEKMKKELGLTTESSKSDLRKAILPILDNIVDEIKNVIHFHQEHALDHSLIDKVILSGSSAKLIGIEEYISARLNLGAKKPIGRVVLGNTWTNFGAGMEREIKIKPMDALTYTTVAGLALRGVREQV